MLTLLTSLTGDICDRSVRDGSYLVVLAEGQKALGLVRASGQAKNGRSSGPSRCTQCVAMVISAAPSLSAPTNQKRPGSLPAFVISRGGLEPSDQTGAVGCWIREEASPAGSQLPGNHHSVHETSSLVLVGSRIRHRASAGEARGQRPSGFIIAAARFPPNRNT